MSETAFYLLAALTVVAASGVVFLRNPVHCAMSLVATLFFIAVSYISLRAHLVAALQIIVYAGAVMILFLFVIMLLNLQAERVKEAHVYQKLLGAGAAVAVALLLARVFTADPTLTSTPVPADATLTSALVPAVATAQTAASDATAAGAPVSAAFGTTQALARVLFRDHAVAFELTSLLLLVAVVGAVVLARRERA